MIKYRNYVDTGKGYKCCGTVDVKNTIKLLESCKELNDRNTKVLCIECNYDNNSEFPVFLAFSNEIEEFDTFINSLQENCKTFVKK